MQQQTHVLKLFRTWVCLFLPETEYKMTKNRNNVLSIILIAVSSLSAIAAFLDFSVIRHTAWHAPIVLAAVSALLSDAVFILHSVRSGAFLPRLVQQQEIGDMQSLKALFDRIEECMRVKKNYLYEDFTLTDLASAVYSNKNKVSKAIHSFTGQNFCQYLNKLRLEYAVDLMKRDPHLKTSEVASMSGFHSNGTFHKTFRMYMEGTPSEYMRKVRIRSRRLSMKREREPRP